MQKYPQLTQNDILDFTQTKISTLIEMGAAVENPKLLDKYKTLKFSSEFEFEHYIVDKFKFI
jgi:hypothetical protein